MIAAVILNVLILGMAFGFFVRLVAACFSADIRGRIKKHPKGHMIWGGVAFLVLLFETTALRLSCQSCTGEDARRKATHVSILVIRKSISEFVMNEHRMPNSLDELAVGTSNMPAILDAANLNDSWGHPFVYRQTGGTNFEIRSAGPDGRLEAKDDLTN